MLRKRPSALVQSRFREEFNQPPRPASRRGTLMAKVHRSFERRSKTLSGSTDEARLTPLPSSLTAPHSGASKNTRSVNSGDVSKSSSMTTTWKTRLPVARHRLRSGGEIIGVQTGTSKYLGVNSNTSQIPISGRRLSQQSTVSQPRRDSGIRAPSGMRPAVSHPTRHAPSPHLDARSGTGASTSHLAEPKSQQDTEPPVTWTRFPSETRAERNGSATFERDSVHIHDFAFDAVGSAATLDRSHGSSRPASRGVPRVRSVKLGQRVKSGLTKLLPFMNQNGEAVDQDKVPQEISLYTAHRTSHPVPADMAASSIGGRKPSEDASSFTGLWHPPAAFHQQPLTLLGVSRAYTR